MPYEAMPGEMPRLKLKPLTSISAPPPPPVESESPAETPSVPLPTSPLASVDAPVIPPLSGVTPVPPSPLPVGGPPLIVPATVPIPLPVAPPPPVVLHMPAKPVASAPKVKKSPLGVLLGVLVVALGVAAYFVFLRPTPRAPVVAPAPAVVKSAATPPAAERIEIAPLPPPPSLGPITISTTANPVPAVPVVSPQFRAWVESVRVTGVITGASPKAIINGRLVRPGDMIDATEAIMLDTINAEQKLLVFRNRSGATLSKPY